MAGEEPDERAFSQHIGAGRFQSGVDGGHWRLVEESAPGHPIIDPWPYRFIAVAAAPRVGAPDEVALRFTLDGYPTSAPTSVPWDVARNVPLAHDLWPSGGRVGQAFNPGWNGGTALYIPCDRIAIAGHDPWRDQHKAYLWDSSKDIVDYLKVIHDLLHSQDYSGIRRAA